MDAETKKNLVKLSIATVGTVAAIVGIDRLARYMGEQQTKSRREASIRFIQHHGL